MKQTIPMKAVLGCLFLLQIFAISSCKKNEPAAAQAIDSASSLHVPFIPQRGDNWCWAACTEMVTAYYNDKIDHNAPRINQCELANLVLGANLQCPIIPGEVPAQWDQPTTPFPNVGDSNCEGYSFSQTYGAKTSINPNFIAELPWDSLKWVISHGSPVIFEWHWEGITIATIDSNDTHYMVAEGIPHSSYINDPGWVSVNDPWPIGTGKHRIMTYSEYANHIPTSSPGSNTIVFNAHGVDYFGFTHGGK